MYFYHSALNKSEDGRSLRPRFDSKNFWFGADSEVED